LSSYTSSEVAITSLVVCYRKLAQPSLIRNQFSYYIWKTVAASLKQATNGASFRWEHNCDPSRKS